MKRFRVTPEVITKSSAAFLFGAAVGFVSFRLVNHFSPGFVSAKASESNAEVEDSFEKTQFPLDLEKLNRRTLLKNNTNLINILLRNYPRIEVPVETTTAPEESAQESLSGNSASSSASENPNLSEAPEENSDSSSALDEDK